MRTAIEGRTVSSQPLRDQLAGLPDSRREQLLLDQVRAHAAAALGHPAPEAVDPELPFLEQGFDSLTLLELRNRLNAATGLELSGSAVFDHPTPELLARHLCDGIAVPDGNDSPPGDPRPDDGYAAADPADTGPAAGSLRALYVQAAHVGRTAEITPLLTGLAAFRPAVAGPAGAGR